MKRKQSVHTRGTGSWGKKQKLQEGGYFTSQPWYACHKNGIFHYGSGRTETGPTHQCKADKEGEVKFWFKFNESWPLSRRIRNKIKTRSVSEPNRMSGLVTEGSLRKTAFFWFRWLRAKTQISPGEPRELCCWVTMPGHVTYSCSVLKNLRWCL